MPQTIIDLLKELLTFLFVPSEDFFSEKITYFREKFEFVDSLAECFICIRDSFANPTEFGSITVDLSASESKYNYGSGKINVLDVSWYTRYKPYGDRIISAFMWLVFVFNVFKQLPGIINGASGSIVNVDNIANYDPGKGGKK